MNYYVNIGLFFLVLNFNNGKSDLMSYLSTLRYGVPSPYIIEKEVSDSVYGIPSSIIQLFNLIRQPKACRPGLFNKDINIHLFDSQYIEFQKTRVLPKFEYYEDAASFLLLLFDHMENRLMSPKMMRQLDEFNIFQQQQNNRLTLTSVLLLARVFGKPTEGREILKIFLIIISEYAKNGCADGGYIDVSRNVSKYIADYFVACGWWANCREDSLIFTISSLLKYGPNIINLAFDVTRVYEGLSDFVNSLRVDVHEMGCSVRSNMTLPITLLNNAVSNQRLIPLGRLHNVFSSSPDFNPIVPHHAIDHTNTLSQFFQTSTATPQNNVNQASQSTDNSLSNDNIRDLAIRLLKLLQSSGKEQLSKDQVDAKLNQQPTGYPQQLNTQGILPAKGVSVSRDGQSSGYNTQLTNIQNYLPNLSQLRYRSDIFPLNVRQNMMQLMNPYIY